MVRRPTGPLRFLRDVRARTSLALLLGGAAWLGPGCGEAAVDPGRRPSRPVGSTAVLDGRSSDVQCDLHQVAMQTDLVEAFFGMPYLDPPEHYRAQASLFPHAATEYQGGCISGPEKQAWVSFCPDCRRAKAQWEAQQ